MNKLIAFFALTFIISIGYGQECGEALSLSSAQQVQLNAIGTQLEQALFQENLSAIDSLSNIAKSIFDAEAGKPDSEGPYYNLVNNTSWQNLNNSILLSRQLIGADSAVYANLWKVAKGMAPPSYLPHSIPLRAAAEVAVGLLKIADKETDLSRKLLYQTWANKALDSLATMQLSNGAFPFPDLRNYNDPVFTPIIQNYLNSLGADSSSVLQNGWIINDNNLGEFKFDAGVICNAYYEAFIYSGNINYKNIALSIADYLLPLKLNSNYNYNTFVSLGLTRAFQLTNDTVYLNRSLFNLRYGLFPGQIENGRWMDGHNANSRYHNIILYNLFPTINLIPETYIYKSELEFMQVKAVENLINYTNNCGSATGFRWLISAYKTDSSIFTANTRNEIRILIGRYINQAALNGKYLDVQSLGLYIELLGELPLNIKDGNELNVKMNIFPNPFNHETNIVIELLGNEEIQLSLHDISGKLVKILDTEKKIAGNYSYSIKEDLVAGIYFVTLTTVQGSTILKMLKN
jgi:hypothetical protein